MANEVSIANKGIRVKITTLYLWDPAIAEEYVDKARDWAIKTDGMVTDEDGNEEDYSSKAWAIGGQGTETNNSKYWAQRSEYWADKVMKLWDELGDIGKVLDEINGEDAGSSGSTTARGFEVQAVDMDNIEVDDTAKTATIKNVNKPSALLVIPDNMKAKIFGDFKMELRFKLTDISFADASDYQGIYFGEFAAPLDAAQTTPYGLTVTLMLYKDHNNADAVRVELFNSPQYQLMKDTPFEADRWYKLTCTVDAGGNNVMDISLTDEKSGKTQNMSVPDIAGNIAEDLQIIDLSMGSIFKTYQDENKCGVVYDLSQCSFTSADGKKVYWELYE